MDTKQYMVFQFTWKKNVDTQNVECILTAERRSNRRKRNWEVHQGRNKFYCNGRCVSSPDVGGYLCTLCFILVTGNKSTIYWIL